MNLYVGDHAMILKWGMKEIHKNMSSTGEGDLIMVRQILKCKEIFGNSRIKYISGSSKLLYIFFEDIQKWSKNKSGKINKTSHLEKKFPPEVWDGEKDKR